MGLAQAMPSGTPSVIPDSGGLEKPMGVLYQNPNFPSKTNKKVKIDTVYLSSSSKKDHGDSLSTRHFSRRRKQ
jgi:hypothetical protein